METPPVLELRSRVPAPADGMSLIEYLLRRFPYHDRERWLREIADGRLAVDGRIADANEPLRRGARLCYTRLHVEPAVDSRFVLLHDEPALVVVRKPAHLPMHADGPFIRNTLIHLLRCHLDAPDLHVVHRLDRETSGLCVLARTQVARESLHAQFAAGSVAKAYLAVVRGAPAGDFTSTAPIGHSATSVVTMRRSASADAKHPRAARTDFEVQRRSPGRCLLRCVPHTGRTHQIRAHLEAVGHPLLGDKLYGCRDEDFLAFVARVKAGGAAADAAAGEPGRHLLHASELAFDHPTTGQRLSFTDPLPTDFEPWVEGLIPTKPD